MSDRATMAALREAADIARRVLVAEVLRMRKHGRLPTKRLDDALDAAEAADAALARAEAEEYEVPFG